MGMLQHDEAPNYPAHSPKRPTAKCHRCGDLGLWIEPTGRVATCPVIQTGERHGELNDAAKMVARSIELLKEKDRLVHANEFEVVRCLAHFTSASPCERDLLLTYFGWDSGNRLRRFHKVIEDLRRDWLLPVASRKDTPAGYWIATEAEDFQEWVRRSKSAPITQLTTIHRLAKEHFKPLAAQLELEFDAIKEAA